MRNFSLLSILFCFTFTYVYGQKTYNANEVANRVLKGSSYVRVDAMYVSTDQNYSQSETIHTGKKDAAGNAISYLKLTIDPKSKEENNNELIDSLLLVPDFAPYPLFYYLVNLSRNVPMDGSRRITFKLPYESLMAISDSKTGSLFSPWRTFGSQKTPELRFVYSQQVPSKINPFAYNKIKSTWTKELNELNAFFSTKNPELSAALKAQWEAARAYMQSELDNAKKSTYDAEIKKILSSADEFRVLKRGGESSSDDYSYFYAKLNADTATGITNFKIQLPFTDNEYYYKPQFYSNDLVKNKSGVFETTQQNELNIKGGEIIPFGGTLIIGKTEAGKFRIYSVIAPVELTPMAVNMIKYGTVHCSNINNASSGHPYKYLGEIYKEAQMKENLTTSHDFSKDSLNVEFFLLNYINTLLKK